MQSTTAKKLAAVEEKLAELSGLGKKIKKLEKEVASLSKKIEAPKDWRLMVGRLADTKISREAVALGAEIRRKQTYPCPTSPTFWRASPACHSTRKPPRDS